MEIMDEIDRGGFARVEKVKLSDGTLVAKKTFDPKMELLQNFDRATLRKRFRREVKVQLDLPTKYFIPILESNLEEENPWFTMPFCEKNFKTEIAESRDKKEIPKGLSDILNGLEYLEALDLTHRDIKPANILFHEDVWKIADFGLVTKHTSSDTTTLTSANMAALGSEYYCSPEQHSNFGGVTPHTDMYAFGSILHDIFSDNPLSRIPYNMHTCGAPFGDVIERCTEKRPTSRYKNIGELRNTLLPLLIEQDYKVKPSPSELDWIESIQKLENWDQGKLNLCVSYLTATNNEGKYTFYIKLTPEQIETMKAIDENAWVELVNDYCDWVSLNCSGFDFDGSDVIVGRLEKIYDLGRNSIKSTVIFTAAKLGATLNRWYVMRKVKKMCSHNIDENLAQRVAMDMKEHDALNLNRCVRQLTESKNVYHPIICAKL